MKLRELLLFVILVFIIHKIEARVSEDRFQDDYSDYNAEIYKKYAKMDKQLKGLAEKSVKWLLPYLLEAREHINISETCSKNLFDLINGFRKLTNWSLNFLDAMGKLPSGIQSGNFQMFGEYEECIETLVMKRGKLDFEGQYCLLNLKPLLPKVKKIPKIHSRLEGLVNATRNSSSFIKYVASRAHYSYETNAFMGICVPSGCAEKDVSEIVKYTFKDIINARVDVCLKNGDIIFWTRTRIIIVCIFVLLVIVSVISTCLDNTLDTWKSGELGLMFKILQCFSLTRNFPKLMETDTSQKHISCLQGIRVLTIFWVVLGHEYLILAVTLTANHSWTYEKMLSSFFSQLIFNASICIGIFFFISGFVNCYARMLIKQEGKPQPGFFQIIFYRFWRIYPTYIIALLLMELLNKPQPFTYRFQENYTQMCNQYWWRNFLFIHNFFSVLELCMTQSWFLSADTQLFLLTLVTIPILLRKPKKGIILHVGIILISILCCMVLWLVYDLPPATADAGEIDHRLAVKRFQIFVLPIEHVGSYFMGILFGYAIATKKEIKIPKVVQLFGWPVASLFFISMIFMTLRWNSGTPYTPIESALYGAWSRTVMVSGFSWLFLCCVTGHARLFNYILSLKLWTPLSRITYMIYLISPIIQLFHNSHLRFPQDFSHMEIIWNYFANLFISILMSFALVLISESPMIAMQKVLFQRSNKNQKSSSELPKELTSSNINDNGTQENGKFTTNNL